MRACSDDIGRGSLLVRMLGLLDQQCWSKKPAKNPANQQISQQNPKNHIFSIFFKKYFRKRLIFVNLLLLSYLGPKINFDFNFLLILDGIKKLSFLAILDFYFQKLKIFEVSTIQIFGHPKLESMKKPHKTCFYDV